MAFEWLEDAAKAALPLVAYPTRYAYDKVKGAVVKDTSGEADAQKLVDLWNNLQYTDPSSNPEYAAALAKLKGYSSGALTPEDRAREYEALGQAQQFAQGQQGAISQDAAARGGGGAGVNSVKQQVAAQGAATRLGSADVATAGMASQRALAAQQEFARQMQLNTEMQNQFAIQKAGGQTGSLKNMQDLKEREDAALNANRDALINEVGGWAMGVPSAPKPPVTAGSAGIKDPSLAGTGYVPQDGFGGFKSSMPTYLSQAPATTPAGESFSSGPMTASEAAAKAYSESLHPFGDVAAPGSAPSMASRGPDYGNIDNPTFPRKPVIPSF